MGFVEAGERAGDVPLFALADNAANGNKQRGHIALVADGERASAAHFVDTGPVLQFSAQFGGEMTPATVRELAAELLEWADRKEHWCGPTRGFIFGGGEVR